MVLRFFILAAFLFVTCAEGERDNPDDRESKYYVPWGSSSSRQSSSSLATTYTLDCAAVPSTGIVSTTVIPPVVTCNGIVVGYGLDWTGAPNWNNPAIGTYSSISVEASYGECNGKTARCSGTLKVSAAPSVDELTCTGMPMTGVAGTAITQPTVRCGTNEITTSITWANAPNWFNPSASTYNVSATANCGGNSKTASCGRLTVTSVLACGFVPPSGTAGTAITPPTVTCNGKTVSSGLGWEGAPNWSNPMAGTYSYISVYANSGNCSGETAECSGTLTVGSVLACASVPSTGIAGATIIPPTVTCNGITVPSGVLNWTGAPNWNNPVAGTHNNISVSASSGECNGKTATCGGSLTIGAAPSADELTCTGMPMTGVTGTAITQPTVRCGINTVTSSITWANAPNWNNPTSSTYNVSATANCGGKQQTASCGTLTVASVLSCATVPTAGVVGTAITAPAVTCDGTTISSGLSWTGAPTWNNPIAGTYSGISVSTNSGNCSGKTATCSGTLTVASTYTVTYNAGTGVTGVTLPANQTKTQEVALILNISVPTRTGYTFVGWNTSANGSGTSYASGTSYTANADVTLYAQWTVNTYTVTYNANNGTGAPANQTKTYDVALTLSTSVPTRAGYTFAGWNTSANGSGTSYASGASYTANANVTLYAQWTANTYTVTYNANNGTGGPTSQTKTQDVALTLSTSVPTRTGYTFAGWNTSANGNGTSYASGASYTANADVTLYAQWTAKTYTVTYNANNGSGEPASQTKTYDVALTLSTSVPTRTGYTFTGWNTSANGNGTSYASGASYTANADITLYAKWTANTYSVTYNANSGTGGPTSQTKTYDVALTLNTSVPTRTGYTFAGWNTSSNGSGTSYASGASYTANADVTLYAQWTVSTYTVTYNANDGTGAPASQTKTYDVALTLSTSVPTRAGYTFASWNTSANGNGTSYASGASYTANANVTLYAKWTANTYTVTYNANGGTGAPASQTKIHDVALTLSSTVPTRTGYTFASWNTAADGSGTSYASGASYTDNAGVTLYAQWTVSTYTITYNANNGTGAPASQTKTYDVALTLSTSVPTRTGYDFAGWNTSSSGNGTSYAYGANYTANVGVTLYAQWSRPVVSNCDGQIFRTVVIGTQTWMAENLNCNVSGSKCYDNSEANCDKYGRLYNWATAMGICPSGWHIPSDADWDKLVNYVESNEGCSSCAARYLKTSDWKGEGKYGFSALPGGYGISGGSFYGGVGSLGRWWSATEYGSYDAYYRNIGYYDENVYYNYYIKSYLFSVRCLQD